MRLFYTDHHELPLPEGHRFPIRKYRMARELIAAEGLYDFTAAPLARPEVIELTHEAAYVRAFMAGSLDTRVMRRIGFPWSEGLVSRTLASVGGTLAATEDALEKGFGGTLAGGTHHAFRGEGSGFCVFNDIAVAIRSAQANGRVRRAAVIDLDVHQGDGTAAIFDGEPGVLTVSVHGKNNFPFRKQRSAIDVELADGTGDEEYLRAVEAVPPKVAEFAPEIVFYQSGVDALATDRLGRLSLTPDGLMARDRAVFEFVRGLSVPIVVTLGGGYSEPIERTAEAHRNTFVLAHEFFNPRS